ncbi:helix-turn-helix domain-containing protein [Streptomyces sp. ISL-99]|uniref:MarR family transcriptional regulator n=1 Tax=Streptomyces sp. ISL-99 TaxID=2819193 RepID=UPI0027E4F141|nr:helix-turn-helix domain-containing protein [Streptomyces sp. ISL-99]
MARHPGATPRQVAQALGIPERRVTANFDRLTDDGLLAVASDSAPGAPRSYLLLPVGGEEKQPSGT